MSIILMGSGAVMNAAILLSLKNGLACALIFILLSRHLGQQNKDIVTLLFCVVGVGAINHQ